MRVETHTVNGTEQTFKVTDEGTYYHVGTPDSLVHILEKARTNKTRIKVYLGDAVTGKDWMEESDKMGFIGRSSGPIKIPIIMKYETAKGGTDLMPENIVKLSIAYTGTVLYQTKNYHQPSMELVEDGDGEDNYAILIDEEVYSRHKTERSAKLLFKKLS